MWSLSLLYGFFSSPVFLLQFKNMQVRFTGDSNVAIGVNVNIRGCLCLCVSPATAAMCRGYTLHLTLWQLAYTPAAPQKLKWISRRKWVAGLMRLIRSNPFKAQFIKTLFNFPLQFSQLVFFSKTVACMKSLGRLMS